MKRLRDCVVIGGGQAGLAMSQVLSARGIDHVVIERGRIGERWLSQRWPSLRLLTPNWMTRLPGPAPRMPNPEGFMTARHFANELEAYGQRICAPVIAETTVLSLSALDEGYIIETTAGSILTKAVVIATGACDKPAVPAWAAAISADICQLASDHYRGPHAVPAGGVLVVGASATGTQIARELCRWGRDVILSVGRHVRAPRRYRGRDLFKWLDESGFLSERLPANPNMAHLRTQPSLQLAGSRFDGEPHLGNLAAEGVTIVGRALSASATTLRLGRDLTDQCLASERRRHKLLARIDAHILANGPELPEDPEAWGPAEPLTQSPSVIDLKDRGIGTIIWATGYHRTYPWLKVPVLDATGEIRNTEGVTPAPGLFVLGLPFQRHRASAFIDGVGRDAETLGPEITRYLTTSIPAYA